MTRLKTWSNYNDATTGQLLYSEPYFVPLGLLEEGTTLLRLRVTLSLEFVLGFDNEPGNAYPMPWFPFQTITSLNWCTEGQAPIPYWSGGRETEDYLWVSQVNWTASHFQVNQAGVMVQDGVYCLNTEDSRVMDTKSERISLDGNSGPYVCVDTHAYQATENPDFMRPIIQFTARVLTEQPDS